MFTIIKPGTKIDFVGKMRICAIISVITVVACLVLVATRMNYGVDFRGGAEIEIKSKQTIALDDIRSSLEKGGIKGASIQTIGEAVDNEVLLKIHTAPEELDKAAAQVETIMKSSFTDSGV